MLLEGLGLFKFCPALLDCIGDSIIVSNESVPGPFVAFLALKSDWFINPKPGILLASTSASTQHTLPVQNRCDLVTYCCSRSTLPSHWSVLAPLRKLTQQVTLEADDKILVIQWLHDLEVGVGMSLFNARDALLSSPARKGGDNNHASEIGNQGPGNFLNCLQCREVPSVCLRTLNALRYSEFANFKLCMACVLQYRAGYSSTYSDGRTPAKILGLA